MKRISVYGRYRVKVKARVKQRFWKRRIDGIKQRYWKYANRTKWEIRTGRYEFTGSGRELFKAVAIAREKTNPPKGFVEVAAKVYIRNPELYIEEDAEWLETDEESG